VAASLIAEGAVDTLVLVHRRELLEHWIDRLEAFLNLLAKTIGRIGDGCTKRPRRTRVEILYVFHDRQQWPSRL
jgi:superfamily II DNA or RNA helicase